MSAAALIPWVLATPLLGAVLITLAGRWPDLRDAVSVSTAVVLFALVVQLLPEVAAGARPAMELFELLPGLMIAFKVEPLGMAFALLASGLWVITAIYAIGYMRATGEQHQTRFYACFAIALFSVMGIALAGNMLTLFVCYEILSLSTYPLVAHKGTEAARRGARVYLAVLLGTSIGLLLPAIVITWWLTGNLDFTPGGIMQGHVDPALGALLLVLFMFGIGKAALMPMHRWLPAAMVAPTPVSALLHAVAVVKAGVFTVLKVGIYLFGVDYLRELVTTELVMYVAAWTMIAASVIALRQDNLKARLAYSTVGQLSYIVLGMMLANEIASIGSGMHIVMHAFGKITLFFCAGAIYVATHKTEISQMNGLGRRMPWTMGAFLLGALCVIGAPPLGAFWSKWHLMLGAIESEHGLMVAVFMLSTVLNFAYLVPPVVRAFLLAPDDGTADNPRIREAPLLCVLPLCLTALGGLVMFILAGPLHALLGGMFTG